MRIGIPAETTHGERRVAAMPSGVKTLQQLGFEVLVERGAGDLSDRSDAAYEEVGATMVDSAADAWGADVVLTVNPPSEAEVEMLAKGSTLVGFIRPADNPGTLNSLAERGVTTVAMDCVPRITRAQSMDANSAMSNIAGYRAVVEAANAFPHFFGGQMTAAGRVDPAKVLVIGGGVAGLSAIGTARGLGAIVRAFDTRLAVKEEVESLGGEFLMLDFEEEGEGGGGYGKTMSEAFVEAELQLFAKQALEVDIIITTALIPGREAPKLITAGMVESMKEGSVIVDLAAERGGNCTLTESQRRVEHHGVTIIGYTDLPSRMAAVSSRLYGMTIANLLELMGGADAFHVDMEDDVVRSALITHDGEVTWPPPPPSSEPAPVPYSVDTGARPDDEAKVAAAAAETEEAKSSSIGIWLGLLAIAVVLALLGSVVPDSFLSHFTVFVLACFVGWQVVWNVTPALHTPLMSVTNAISGIIIIGGMLLISGEPSSMTTILGAAAVLLAAINVSGGFLVTHRMLGMFKR